MGHDIEENKALVIANPSHAEEHPAFVADVAIRMILVLGGIRIQRLMNWLLN